MSIVSISSLVVWRAAAVALWLVFVVVAVDVVVHILRPQPHRRPAGRPAA